MGLKKIKNFWKVCFRLPLETLGIFLLWGFSRIMGRCRSIKLFGWLGRHLGPLILRKKTALARQNLNAAFPEKSPQEIQRIIEAMWENLGRIPAEYGFFYNFQAQNPDFCEIRGREHLEALVHDNKPGILFAGHLANWGIVSMVTLQCGLAITQIYRRFNNKAVDWIINKTQNQGGIKTLWKGAEGGREALNLLKQGQHLVIFVDQKLKEGIPIPFFGRMAMTAPAAARLALVFDCPLVPVRVERLPEFKFRVTYYPPLEKPTHLKKHEAIQYLLLKINAMLEQWIREKPEEWLWVHSRWGGALKKEELEKPYR